MKMKEDKYLELMYDKLYGTLLLKDKKIKENSLLFTFFDIKSNDRLRLLIEGGTISSDIPLNIKKKLLNNKYIRETSEVNIISLTAKGIFHVEKLKEKLNHESIIEKIDHKFFNLFHEVQRELTEKEKIIILSLISARAFSIDSTADLKRSNKAQEEWGEIFVKCYHFLKKLNIITKLTEEDLFGKKGLEHPVSNVFRHTDSLPKLTRTVFSAPGNQKYFLNLYEKDYLDLEKLRYILKKIFKDLNIDYSLANEISEFFRDITYTKDVYLFDQKKHIFSDIKYDKIINDLLRDL